MKNNKLHEKETYLSYNLRYLVTQIYKNQKNLASVIEIAESTLTKYIYGTAEPPIRILMKISELHNISVDKLLYQCIDDKEEDIFTKEINDFEQPLYDRFLGFYHVYYFNTNKNYMNSISREKSLKYGILLLYKETNVLGLATYYSTAIFGLNRENLKYHSQSKHKKINEIIEEFERASVKGKHIYFYKGVFNVMGSAIYVDLVNAFKEKVSIILPNPNSEKEYIGGLGTINSLSRGGDQNACVQYIGISKEFVKGTDEEIGGYLSLNNYQFNLKEESKLLIEKFKHFYGSADGYLPVDNLTALEKEVLMQHNFELIVKKIFDNQRLKIGYLSNEQEKAWYKYIKEFHRDKFR